MQNAEGGVDGRKIKLIAEDDQTTTAGGLTAAQLLTSLPVFGVMDSSTEFEEAAPYLLKLGVPVTESVSPTGGESNYTDEFTYGPMAVPTPPTSTKRLPSRHSCPGSKTWPTSVTTTPRTP